MAENFAEQIDEAELARRFAEKRRLLEAAGQKVETKEVFRQTFREQVKEAISAPAPMTQVPPATPPAVLPPAPLPQTPVGTDGELKSLINLALEKGVIEAVRKAEAESPYLIDALHDELADHYYDKLVALGKVSRE